MKRKVSVSFLSSKNKEEDLIKLGATDADYIHVDVMDGKFVKNKNLPFKLLDRLSYTLQKRLDVHLMVNKPNKFIEEYATLNSEYITIHVELPKEVIDSSIELIKSYGIKCGLAIKPNTDINLLKDYLDRIDLILVMSVEPGSGGQEFISETPNRIAKIKELIGKKKIAINVDGGINDKTVKCLDKANIVVSGSYVVNSDSFMDAIKSLR